jgi:LemA protein
MGIGTVIFGALGLLIVLWLVLTYNTFISSRNTVHASWSNVDVALKRRHDLIPNLVASVQGYMDHERQTLTAVTDARAAAISASATGNPQAVGQAENALSQSLRSLFAVSENYPNLQASQNFLDLQRQLADTENRIAAARSAYNQAVQGYNTTIQSLPASLVAAPLGFTASAFFDADPADREPVQVRFTQNPPSAAA